MGGVPKSERFAHARNSPPESAGCKDVKQLGFRERWPEREENDWQALAASWALDCDIWSEDLDFFAGGAMWTTNRVEIFRAIWRLC